MPTSVLYLMYLLVVLPSLALAASPCVPVETTERRILLTWPAFEPVDEFTLTAWRLQRTGDHPAILPPLAPEAVTMTDTVEPGRHTWQMKAEFVRVSTGKVVLSDLAPLGDPPPCVVVLATTPPPPTLTGVSVATTLTGVPGMHVRWTLEGVDRPVRIERRAGTDAALPWGHVGSAPGGFYFDLFALTPGVTYCYRTCLLNVEEPACSEERCAVFPAVQ